VGQVNRIPSGFLDLLGVESLGRNPPAFSDAVAPVVVMNELYLAQTLSTHTIDLTHNVTGDQALVTVPAEETWILRSVGIHSQTWAALARQEQWHFSFQNPPRPATGAATSEGDIFTTPVLETVVIPHELTAAHTLGAPIAFLSGSVLKCRLVALNGPGAHTTAINWTFNRLQS